MLIAGDQSGATTRIGDLEYEWDNAQARLKSKDGAAWTEVDGQIDTVLRELRSTNPNTDQEQGGAHRTAGRAGLTFVLSRHIGYQRRQAVQEITRTGTPGSAV